MNLLKNLEEFEERKEIVWDKILKEFIKSIDNDTTIPVQHRTSVKKLLEVCGDKILHMSTEISLTKIDPKIVKKLSDRNKLTSLEDYKKFLEKSKLVDKLIEKQKEFFAILIGALTELYINNYISIQSDDSKG